MLICVMYMWTVLMLNMVMMMDMIARIMLTDTEKYTTIVYSP